MPGRLQAVGIGCHGELVEDYLLTLHIQKLLNCLNSHTGFGRIRYRRNNYICLTQNALTLSGQQFGIARADTDSIALRYYSLSFQAVMT